MRKQPDISRAQLFNKLGYEPHSEAQWDYHNNQARFKTACCGRRWGKSLSTGHDLTYYSFIPDSYYWIVGPTYALGEKEWRVFYHDIKRLLKIPKVKASNNVKQGDMRMELPWNTFIEVKSAEKQDTLVGEGLDGVIMSEAAKHKMSTWKMYIMPSLGDKKGWANFPSTPQGFNWFKGMYDVGQVDSGDTYASWHLPSWTNPVAYPGGENDPEILLLKQTLSEQYFDQEIAAKFTAFTGRIYPDFSRDNNVRPIEYNPFWRNYWAFDYGFNNQFVCLDIMVDPSDNVYVWREYVKQYISTFENGLALKQRENPPGFHVDGMYGDPRGADEAATLLLMLGYINSDDVPWISGIEHIRQLIKPGTQPHLWVSSNCPETIKQMEMLRAPEGKEGGQNATEGQFKRNDHCPDALRYFCGQHLVQGVGDHLDGSELTEAETFFQIATKSLFASIGTGSAFR